MNIMLAFLNMPEILVILAIVILMFGAKKLPELARGIGQGIKEFKKGAAETPEEQKKRNP